jgi:hypothetical protein
MIILAIALGGAVTVAAVAFVASKTALFKKSGIPPCPAQPLGAARQRRRAVR